MVFKWPLQRLTWSESSGAVGDLGTFLPLMIALAVHNGLDIGTTLLFTGLYNIFTGEEHFTRRLAPVLIPYPPTQSRGLLNRVVKMQPQLDSTPALIQAWLRNYRSGIWNSHARTTYEECCRYRPGRSVTPTHDTTGAVAHNSHGQFRSEG